MIKVRRPVVAVLCLLALGSCRLFSMREDGGSDTESSVSEALDPREVFLRLVHSHPSPEVRQIEPLLRAGTVRFATRVFDPVSAEERPVRDMLYIPGQRVIVSNPAFLMSSRVPVCGRQGRIRHEVQHLEDDFAGMNLPPRRLSQSVAVEAAFDAARRMLHTEWRAGLAEREFLQSVSCHISPLADLPTDQLCDYFKQKMLTDDYHLPLRLLAKYPAVRTWIEQVSCDELAGPY